MSWGRLNAGALAAALAGLAAPLHARAQDCAPALPPPGDSSRELLLGIREVHGTVVSEAESLLQTPDGRVWAGAELFARLRVRTPDGPRAELGLRWYALDAIPGVQLATDDCAQALVVDVALEARTLARYDAYGRPPPPVPDPVAPGGYVNLDLQYTRTPEFEAGSGLLDAGFFNDVGYGGQSFLVRDSRPVRLETFWSVEDPSVPRTLRFGDAVNRTGAWGRSLRYGGVQWATDFALTPYLPTFPLPSVEGLAVQPTTLEVFVNQSRRAQQGVDSGPFVLDQVPVVSGAGEVQVVVRDLLGRETLYRQSYYASPQMLRPGLSNLALEGGWIRRDFGSDSADYGPWFLSVTQRRGLSRWLTTEVRAETQSGQGAMGGSAFAVLDDAVLATGTLAFGQGSDGNGWLGSIGLERQAAGRHGVFGLLQRAEAGYTQVGFRPGESAPAQRAVVGANLVVHAGGSVSATWVDERRRAGDDLSLVSASYQGRFRGDWFWSLTAQQIRQDGREHTLIAGINHLFGANRSAGMQTLTRENEDAVYRAEFQEGPEGPLDYGYRVAVEEGPVPRELASGLWQSTRAVIAGDAQSDPAGDSFRVSAATGVAGLGGRLHWTRPVQGSFAVVDTAPLAGVRVYRENQLVGVTDDRGQLLVTGLRPWQSNTFGIDPQDVPLEQALHGLSQEVTPRTRSAVRVGFRGDEVGRQVRIRLAGGSALVPGAGVRDLDSGEIYPVGSGGEVYVAAPPGVRRLEVTLGASTCVVRVDLPGPVADDAPLLCRER